MKLAMVVLNLILFASCGKSSGDGSSNTIANPGIAAEDVIASLTYPSTGKIMFGGELIMDLSSTTPTISSYGTVSRGQTLNVITINEIDFLVYGEDGAFAVECEPNVDYPTHGSSHPNCEVAHAESFDNIIICTSRVKTTPILQAQNWPGYPSGVTDTTIGMQCWLNGVKMKSERIFTY